MNPKEYIGAIIEYERQSQGLSVREVAEKMDAQHPHYIRVTKAQTNYTIDTLLRILDALGLEIKIVRKKN